MNISAALLVLTRPDEGEVERAGIDQSGRPATTSLCVHLPLIELRTAKASARLQADLDWASSADLLIFVSRFAVQSAQTLRPQLGMNRQAQWYAVGPATARELRDRFLVDVSQPTGERANSEGLLELLTTVKGQRCALFAAPDGRQLLFDTLSQRGVEVRQIEVYERVLTHVNEQTLQQLKTDPRQLIFSATSVQVLSAVRALLRRLHQSPQDTPLIVSATRIATAAQELGFVDIRLAASAAITDLVSQLSVAQGSAEAMLAGKCSQPTPLH